MSLRVHHVADINPPTPEFDRLDKDTEIPFVPLEAIWPDHRFNATRRRPKRDVSMGYTRFVEGDILLPKITPTFQADRAVITTGIEGGVGAATTEVHVIRVGNAADSRYIRYLFSSKRFLDEGEASMVGVAGQKRVSDDYIREHIVPVTEPRKQRAIADYLDTATTRINALIDKKREMVKLLEARIKAVRTRTVLGSLDPLNGNGQAPGNWSNGLLGIVIRLHRGFDLPQDERARGDIPVITSGGFDGYHSVAACHGPGVVTGRYGTIGKVFFVDGPYWPLNTTLFVSDFRGNHPRWVYHLLSSLPLDVDSAKSAVTGINRNVIGTLRVPVPPPHTQRAIAALIDSVGDATEAAAHPLQRQIDLISEHRQALITAAISGELDIPGIPA
jgi:type I restriction enzyme S subunit